MKEKAINVNVLIRLIYVIATLFIITMAFIGGSVEVSAAESLYGNSDLDPAVDSTYRIFIDENNYVCIETYDLKKISQVYYRTMAFTVSRCKLNEKTLHDGVNSQYVAIEFNYTDMISNDITLRDGKIYNHNIFRMPLMDIVNVIHRAGYTEWEQEIRDYYFGKGGATCYLKFDAIMIVIDYGKESGKIFVTSDGKLLIDGDVYPNRPEDQNVYIEKLKRARGWRNASRIHLHYNLYIPGAGYTGGGGKGEDVILTDPVALYETKNYSSIFDISKAIPSGENVTNVISAAAFTGNDMSIGTKSVSKNYDVTITLKLKYPVQVEKTRTVRGTLIGTYDDSEKSNYEDTTRYEVVDNGNGTFTVYNLTTETYTETEYRYNTKEVTKTVSAEVKYQYLASAPQLYDYSSMTVYNNHFPFEYDDQGRETRSITYDSSIINVPQVAVLIRSYCEEAAKQGRNHIEIREHMAGSNVKDYNYTPRGDGYHYGLYSTDTVNVTHEYSGKNQNDWGNEDAEILKALNSAGSTISKNCWSRNDYININDSKNSFTLMTDDTVYGAKVYYGQRIVYDGVTAATSAHRYGANYTMEKINKELLAARVGAKSEVTIPPTSDNIDYPTGCEITYNSLFNDDDTITYYAGKNFFAGASVDSIYEHVMKGGVLPGHNGGDPSDGYPIRVHTPIVAPIKIVKNDGSIAREKTQLIPNVSYNEKAEHQLLLDEWYYVEWDNEKWVSSLWGDEVPQGYEDVYDKYVEAKYLRFPFDVVYNKTLYRKTETGYTPWIEVAEPTEYDVDWKTNANPDNYESSNHWAMTPFYIPSFAQEGGMPNEEIWVEAKVKAINASGRDLGDHSGAVQPTLNSKTDNYLASTRCTVQLSGWLYDFTIVGTENGLVYTGQGLGEYTGSEGAYPYALCPGFEEIKSGLYNRLGTVTHRLLADGHTTNSIALTNLLPLTNGKSKAFKNMGAVWKGQDFAFTVKTIANLDGPKDSLEITPTFTYITPEGELLSSEAGDIKIYVLNSLGELAFEYDKNDTNLNEGNMAKEVYLGSPLFKESYYDDTDTNLDQFGDWVTTSVENENTDLKLGGLDSVTVQEYLNRKTLSYSFNHISIPSTLRYISGEYEQLAWNINRSCTRNGMSKYITYENYLKKVNKAQIQKDTIYSMQQWNSMYMVPTTIKIVDVRDKGGKDFDLHQWIEEHPDFNWTGDYIYDDEGYLVINFDIKAYKNGKPYLQYAGDNSSMWDKEGYVNDPKTQPDGDSDSNPDYDPKDGDVVIIDMSKSVNDYYEPALHNIN